MPANFLPTESINKMLEQSGMFLLFRNEEFQRFVIGCIVWDLSPLRAREGNCLHHFHPVESATTSTQAHAALIKRAHKANAIAVQCDCGNSVDNSSATRLSSLLGVVRRCLFWCGGNLSESVVHGVHGFR